MRRNRVMIVGFLGVVLLSAAILISLRAMVERQMYPQAPVMPPIVTSPVQDLLLQHETFLKLKVPTVFASLQPGLRDIEIHALEQKYGLTLPDDLRALYRWRNGTMNATNICAFPDHQFIPLGTALQSRDSLRQQVGAASITQRLAYKTFAGHRDSWIGLIVDAAGDGHFLDPNRTQSQGSFFFNFNEDGQYVFYPAFRNYLAAVVDGEKSGVFAAGTLGLDTVDFSKAQNLWWHYGAVAQR